MADVIAIIITIGSNLFVLNKAGVMALHLYMRQMLLPWWVMLLPLFVLIVGRCYCLSTVSHG